MSAASIKLSDYMAVTCRILFIFTALKPGVMMAVSSACIKKILL